MQRFNFVNRDCPVCYRQGSLTGVLRAGGVLTCKGSKREPGCFASFTYDPAPAFAALARLNTSGAPTKRCACGALIGLTIGSPDCLNCIATAEREQRHYAAGNRSAP